MDPGRVYNAGITKLCEYDRVGHTGEMFSPHLCRSKRLLTLHGEICKCQWGYVPHRGRFGWFTHRVLFVVEVKEIGGSAFNGQNSPYIRKSSPT